MFSLPEVVCCTTETAFADAKPRSPHDRCFIVFPFLPPLCPAWSHYTVTALQLTVQHRWQSQAEDGWCWCVAPSILKCLLERSVWISCWHLQWGCCASGYTAFIQRINCRTLKNPAILGFEVVGWNFLHWNALCCQKSKPKIYILRNENRNWSQQRAICLQMPLL